jgi:hypothetical protein
MNLRDLTLRARALFTPGSAERDLHDELSFHIECETMKLIDQGLSPEDARARARVKFGSTTVAADECRDERGTAFIDNTIGDLQVRPSHIQARATRHAHHRRHGRDWTRIGGRPLHGPERAAVQDRLRTRHHGDLRR